MFIKALILENENGARVKIPIPGIGAHIPSGAVLRNVAVGAVSTDELQKNFKLAEEKLAEARKDDPKAVGEVTQQ